MTKSHFDLFFRKHYNNVKNYSKLDFEDKSKYIFYSELLNKKGPKYSKIIKSEKDSISEYTSHQPSSIELFDVLKKLSIYPSDKILDIGCGKGFALAIMNLFPFKKIAGLEISKDLCKISKNNLEKLSINQIDIFNNDALSFKQYSNYNMFYLYNPFSNQILKEVVEKITLPNSTLIFCNISPENYKTLLENSFEFNFAYEGVIIDFNIFKKI